MRVVRTALLLACLLSVPLLAGCTGNAVTVSGQGFQSGAESKTLECGGAGTLAMGSQGSGKLSVTVKDGDGNTVFQSSDFGAGQDGKAQRVTGVPGTWTLRVSTGFGYAGQWGITLTC